MESIDTRHESQPINLMMIFLIAAAVLLAIVRIATMQVPVAGADLPSANASAVSLQSGASQLSFATGEFWVVAGAHTLHVAFRGAALSAPQAAGSGPLSAPGARYSQLWPGISVAYTTSGSGILHSTYNLAASADPRQIALAYSAPVEVQADGSLAIRLAGGALRESAPVAWQEIDGQRVSVPASFSISQEADGAVVGFSLGAYDPAYPLVIDPVLDWMDGG
jgi:hypothetical protein